MTPVERLIAKFGGLRKFARAIDTSAPTVHHWKMTGGYIPAPKFADVLRAGRTHGIPVTVRDLVADDAHEFLDEDEEDRAA